MQVYRGEGFLLHLDAAEVDLSIENISDEEDIIRNFKGMKVGRPFISSYRHQLKVPLLVQQPDETDKEGYIELIMTNDEYENVKRIISEELPVYLMFRMAMFNDFSSTGYGILYFSFDEEQYETILSSF